MVSGIWNLLLGIRKKEVIFLPLRGHYFDRSTDASLCYSIAHRFEGIVIALFHGILSLEMDQHSALLSLLGAVMANFYERFDHPLESIHLVIPHHQRVRMLHIHERVRILLLQGLSFIFIQPHNANLLAKAVKMSVKIDFVPALVLRGVVRCVTLFSLQVF
jgi:hypothetical protein